MDVKKHIQAIIDDILDNKDISKIFLKVQVLVHLLKNDQLSQWFKSEQHGYKDDLLPEYRVIKVSIHGALEQNRGFAGSLYYKNMILPTSHIKDELILNLLTTYKCREPLGKIQEMTQKEGSLHITVPSACVGLLEQGLSDNCYLNQVWQELQQTDLKNIVEQVKSTLLQFLLELNDSLDLNLDLNSINNKKQIEKAINNTIYATNVTLGENSNINANDSTLIGGQGNNIQISSTVKKEIEEIALKIEALANEIDEDRTDIADAILSIREELENKIPRPKFLKTAFNSFKAIGTGVIANKITPLVDSAIEIINKI
jgi:hypothetical protein